MTVIESALDQVPRLDSSAAAKVRLMAAGALMLASIAGATALVGLRELRSDEPLLGAFAAAALGLGAAGLLAAWNAWHHWHRDSLAAHMAIERLNRFHIAMSATHRLILRRPEATALFQGVCRACVATGAVDRAVVVLQEGGEMCEAVAAHDVAVTAPRAAASVPRREPPLMQRHLLKLVAASGQPIVISDAANDARLGAWHAWCSANAVHALAAIPLKRFGVAAGALLLHSRNQASFDEALVPLFAEMGADLSFALDNSGREPARHSALDPTVPSLQRFHTLFDATPVPMAIVNLNDRKVVKVNPLWCALLVLPAEAQLGRTLEKLGFGLSAEEGARFNRALSTNSPVIGMPTTLRAGDDTLHDVLLHADRVDDVGAKCLLVVATDISDLKAAARTADLARIVAEEADQAKNRFLARIGHELRSPLNAMLGLARLLAADPGDALSPGHAERVRLITHSGWHLLGLVDDVMDIASIEAGRFEVAAVPCDIARVIDEALALSEPLSRSLGVVLKEREPSPDGVGAVADPKRLRRVMLNLLSNACKYNRPGGTVRVDIACADANGDVVIEVVDNGLGMSDERLSHLFEPFNRLGHEGDAIEGSGIGLNLSRQLVEAMNGRLRIESSPRWGTRARIVLPSCELAHRSPAAGSVTRLPHLPVQHAAADVASTSEWLSVGAQ